MLQPVSRDLLVVFYFWPIALGVVFQNSFPFTVIFDWLELDFFFCTVDSLSFIISRIAKIMKCICIADMAIIWSISFQSRDQTI